MATISVMRQLIEREELLATVQAKVYFAIKFRNWELNETDILCLIGQFGHEIVGTLVKKMDPKQVGDKLVFPHQDCWANIKRPARFAAMSGESRKRSQAVPA